MNLLVKLVKKITLSAFFLYGYNLIAINFNMILPINMYTIGLIGILGLPSFFALILFKMFIL